MQEESTLCTPTETLALFAAPVSSTADEHFLGDLYCFYMYGNALYGWKLSGMYVIATSRDCRIADM